MNGVSDGEARGAAAADQETGAGAAAPGLAAAGWRNTGEASEEVSARPDGASLAECLMAGGYLADGRWRRALLAVPRHLFIPDVALAKPVGGGGAYLMDKAARPGEWWRAVYSDTAIVTQLDDGGTEVAAGAGDYTSSASAPSLVFGFLELLDPYPGDEVLEIGTGTGWTAGLLAHALGAENVTSIEVDAGLTARAAANLKRAGYAPELITGDGAEGDADRAPYDRVHVTCGIATVPFAWVAQTRLGGIIVAPWMPGFGHGYMLRLTVIGDEAVGRFHDDCDYMLLRSQRRPVGDDHGTDRISDTWLDPRRVAYAPAGAKIAVAGMLPGVSATWAEEEGGGFRVWLRDAAGRAQVQYHPDYKRPAVIQEGARDLWDEVRDAYLTWVSWGEPGRERFGLTVGPDEQTLWLDTPQNPVSVRRRIA